MATRRHHALLIVVLVSVFGTAASGASAQPSWPVLSCLSQASSGLPYCWKAEPRHLCVSVQPQPAGGVLGIDDAHRWKGWGTPEATSIGKFVDGLGFETPARVAAYGLQARQDPTDNGRFASWYTRLRLRVKAGRRPNGNYLGAFTIVLHTIPYFAHCGGFAYGLDGFKPGPVGITAQGVPCWYETLRFMVPAAAGGAVRFHSGCSSCASLGTEASGSPFLASRPLPVSRSPPPGSPKSSCLSLGSGRNPSLAPLGCDDAGVILLVEG